MSEAVLLAPGAPADAVVPQNRGMGRRPLKEPWVQLATRVPREVKERLDRYAEERGVLQVDVLIRAIEAYTARDRTVIPYPRVKVPREDE